MSNGPLSQNISNLQAEKANISSITGLPADAQQVQSETVALLDKVIPEVQSVQSNALAFANEAQSTLNGTLQALQEMGNKGLPAALATLQDLQGKAVTVQSNISGSLSQIQSAHSQMAGYVQTITAEESALTSQQASLSSQLSSAQSEAASAKKKELYLIALGPLGLPGLAAAIALYEKMQNEVNDLESRAQSLARQQSQVQNAEKAVSTLASDFQSVVGSVSNVNNAVEFVANDINEDIGDVSGAEESGNTTIVTLYIHASLSEVATLMSDAS